MSRTADSPRHDASAALAEALGVRADELDEALREGSALRARWRACSPTERAALTALVHLGGAASSSSVAAEVALAATEMPDAGLPEAGETAARAATEALEDLWQAGLLCRDRGTRDWFVPPALASALVALLAEELKAELRPCPAPAASCDEHLLACAFDASRRDVFPLTRSGRPHRRHLEQLADTLRPLLAPEAGHEQVEEVLTILRQVGALRLVEGELRPDPEAAARWAESGRTGRALLLLASEWGDEDAPRLLRQLREAADCQWPLGLSRLLFRRLVSRSADAESPEDLGAAGDRHAAAVAQLRRAGLLSVDGDGLALTQLGRDWPEAPEPAAPDGFHVGNDLSVLLPRGLDPAVHVELGGLARLESADVVARYRLDRDVILDALDHGASPESILDFLQQHARPTLPEGAADDVRRWCLRFGEITTWEGVALVCEVANRREEFEAIVQRSHLAASIVAPGVAVVAPEDCDTLRSELVGAGLTARRRARRPHGDEEERADGPAAPLLPGRELALVDWKDLPRWHDEVDGGRGRTPTPPPALLRERLTAKYRREFGRRELEALADLDVEELLEMEERGLVRRYLAGRHEPPDRRRDDVDLVDYQGSELVPITPARAEMVLELAKERALACEIAFVESGGRRTVLQVEPLGLRSEAGIDYLRARRRRSRTERLLALDRILALRLLR